MVKRTIIFCLIVMATIIQYTSIFTNYRGVFNNDKLHFGVISLCYQDNCANYLSLLFSNEKQVLILAKLDTILALLSLVLLPGALIIQVLKTANTFTILYNILVFFTIFASNCLFLVQFLLDKSRRGGVILGSGGVGGSDGGIDFNLGYSFYMSIAAMVIYSIICLSLIIIGQKKIEQEQHQQQEQQQPI